MCFEFEDLTTRWSHFVLKNQTLRLAYIVSLHVNDLTVWLYFFMPKSQHVVVSSHVDELST